MREAARQRVRFATEGGVFDGADRDAAHLAHEHVGVGAATRAEVEKAERHGGSGLRHAGHIERRGSRRVKRRKVDRNNARHGRIARAEVRDGEAEKDAERRRIVLGLEILVRLAREHVAELACQA